MPTTRPLGIVWAESGGRGALTRLDPRSLRPRGPRLGIPEFHDARSFSPDRSLLALAISRSADKGGRVGIRIVDVARMRVHADVVTGIAAEALAWLAPDRLVAVLLSGAVVSVDPASGEVVQRWDPPAGTPFDTVRSARTQNLLVAVLAGAATPRPARFVVVDRAGRVRSTLLRRIRVGHRPAGSNWLVPQVAGVALDASGRRAFVAGSRTPVAAIDLATLRVRYHRVRSRARPVRRAVAGSDRQAVWLGRRRMAIFGHDYLRTPRGRVVAVPAGVQVVRTDRWTARTIDRRAGDASLAAGRLLVHTPTAAPRATGAGLGIHTQAGRRLHHLFADRTLDVQAIGRYAYALGRRTLSLVDVRSGEIVHRTGRPRGIVEIDLLGD